MGPQGGRGKEGAGSGTPWLRWGGGRRLERGEARAPDCPGGRSPARLRGPRRVALGKGRTPPGRRLGSDESGLFFFFPQCVVRAWAAPSPRPGPRPARPEPAGVTQGRTPRARARALPSRPRRPLPTSAPAPAAIPPGRGSAPRASRLAPELGRRGPSHCDTAAPGRACAAAAASPQPRRRRQLTRISRLPKWLRRRLHLVAGPGPG